jgi:hypothetical protein
MALSKTPRKQDYWNQFWELLLCGIARKTFVYKDWRGFAGTTTYKNKIDEKYNQLILFDF